MLLAGPQSLALGDHTALAFRLGRALTYLLPGRAVAGSLPSRQLKQTVLAAMTLVQSSLRIDDPEGEIRAMRTALATDRAAAGARARARLRAHRRRRARPRSTSAATPAAWPAPPTA